MVAGRKMQTAIVNESGSFFPNPAMSNISHRNLRKSHLGGVIFGCKHTTIKECLYKQLFGLPAPHFTYVKNLEAGLPLFLFNYSDRKLHGIFEAACSGQMNINPYGWTTDGSEKTQYPAQVQVKIRLQCQPLPEEQFKPVIVDNYYTRNHFWFELDHAQANKLMSLLASQAVAPGVSMREPTSTTKWTQIFRVVPSTDAQEEGERFKPLSFDVEHSNNSTKKLDFIDAAASLDRSKREDEGSKPLTLEADHFSYSSRESDSTDFSPSLDEELQPSETHSEKRLVEQDEKDVIFMKLKEISLHRECQQEDSAVMNDTRLEEKDVLAEQLCSDRKNEGSPYSSSHYPPIVAKMVQEMEELKAFKTEQTLKMGYLEQKLVEAEAEICRLKDRCMMLESVSNPSIEHADHTVINSSEELQLDPIESIFLVGGYDGESWLSTFDSYFPSRGVIKSLRSMSSVRSYASVAKLTGELYVFGGGNGQTWYDTVESYSLADDQWTLRPSLNQQKGSLGGAALNDKIFAIGGGNGVQCFSDVEMLDPELGRWIGTRSMLQKRFALAAAELNGVIYATGGYDGSDYMASVEKFDPREHSWTKIASMQTKRGCHSLIVLNEKLYALGGFDGSVMVPSVEIFDPRLGFWMTGDPLKQARGYTAAAVVKDSIYVIGGVIQGDNILETVERFREGKGWEEFKAEAIGKRCFMSAMAL